MPVRTPPDNNFSESPTHLNAEQYYQLLKNQGGGGPSFSGDFTDLTNKPTTLAGYGITDGQPLDADLTALAAVNAEAFYYKSTLDPTPAWSKVRMGSNLRFSGGVLNTVNFYNQLPPIADDTLISAATLDLSLILDGANVDVTGDDDIDTITLPEGREVTLRFQGAPTIEAGTDLRTPGGEDIHVTAGGFVRVLGLSSGVQILTYSDANDYSRWTFDNIYMLGGANIGYADQDNPYFDIGRSSDSMVGGSFWRITLGDLPALIKHDTSGQAYFDINSIVDGKTFSFPNYSGTFSLIAGTESLTNKKLGDLTTNGFVRVNAGDEGDGTLSVQSIPLEFAVDEAELGGPFTIADPLNGITLSVLGPGGASVFGNNTGDQTSVSGNAGTATALATGRTLAITGDVLWTSPTFDGSGNVTAAGTVVKASGAFSFTGIISPTALDNDVNDYDPAGLSTASVVRLTDDGAGDYSITGLAGGTNGRIMILQNDGPSNKLIPGYDGGSSASNQFGHGFSTIILAAGNAMIFQYSTADNTWKAAFNNPTPWSQLSGSVADNTELQGYLDTLTAGVAASLPLAGGTMTGLLTLRTGSTGAGTAPLKFVSGGPLTTPVAGCMEFTTDILYFTKTTSATRTSVVLGPATGPITIIGPTAARTVTFPNAAFTAARTDAANTFTGVQTMTSPALTTPAITGLATGSGVASAATASTLVARDASGDITGNRLIAGAAIRLNGYTVAALPAGTQGDMAFATDLLTPTFLVAAVGGGAVVGPVFYNGTTWVSF